MYTPNAPMEQAMQVYATEPCRSTFPQDLTLHLRHGYVMSNPTFFLMGRPVDSRAPAEFILDIAYQFDRPDAWFVWLAAGISPMRMLEAMPYWLPTVGWERGNKIRFYSHHLLYQKLHARHKLPPVLGPSA